MSDQNSGVRFFLGSNSPQGFVSRFDQLSDPTLGWRTFIIKGGPGTGKSTLMKKAASAMQDICPNLEYIHCSSDVDSLDAVIFPQLRVSIADGTAPQDAVTKTQKAG